MLKEEERRLTAELYTLKYGALEAELKERQAKIQSLEVEFEQAAAAQQSLDTEIEQARQAHADQSEGFNEIQGKYYQLGADIARIEEAVQFNQERVKQLELDLETVAQRTQETTRQLEMDEGEIGELKNQIARIGPEVREAEFADKAAQEAAQALEEKFRQWQRDWDEFTRAAAEHAFPP